MPDFPSEALPAIFSKLHGADLHTLLALVSVNRLWREIALSDTALWTTILVPPALAPLLTDKRLIAVLVRAQRKGFQRIDLTGCNQITGTSLDAIAEECGQFPTRLSFVGCAALQWTHVLALLERLQSVRPPQECVEQEQDGSKPLAGPPNPKALLEAANQSGSYLEVPGGVVRNPHLPRAALLTNPLMSSHGEPSARSGHKLVRPERRLRKLEVAEIDFRRCKWRQLRTLMQYTEKLDVGECEDERCFQIRTVQPCASCLSECCDQHLYRCQLCGLRTCREHCFGQVTSEGEPTQGICNRCHMRGLSEAHHASECLQAKFKFEGQGVA